MTLVLLNDVDDLHAANALWFAIATIVKTQESANERRNKQLFISIGKEDK